MGRKEDSCLKFHKFINENKGFLNNQIIKAFLSKEENYQLFKKALCYPTLQNQELLDKTFRAFYFYIRFTAYVSSTLYFHGINLDKRIRKTNYRFPITLDQPMDYNSEISHKDLVEHRENFEIESENLLDYIINPNLYDALQEITPNQMEILHLVYVKGFTDTEVSFLLNKSQQAVSKSRSKALKKVRKYMEGISGEYTM